MNALITYIESLVLIPGFEFEEFVSIVTFIELSSVELR